MQNLDILLDDLDVLDEFIKDDYQKLAFREIEAVSHPGENDEGAALIDSRWIPKSQMRCDFDKNIYVINWLYAKL